MSRWALLQQDELPVGKRNLMLGSKGQDVFCLQNLLSKLGIYAGEESGRYDLLTMEAVKTFQKAYQIYADGVVGPDTNKLLTEEGVKNRIIYQPTRGDTLSMIATKYGVGLTALKDPESRKRLRTISINNKVLIEKREIILGVTPETAGELSTNCDWPVTAEKKLVHFKVDEIKTLQRKKKRIYLSSLTLSITEKTVLKWLKKTSHRLRYENNMEIGWWVNHKKLLFPLANEADYLIISPQLLVSALYSQQAWRREIKNILSYYPCTRLIIHFDLRGKEKTSDGEERFLTTREKRMVSINKIGSPRRLGRDGWLYYRYRIKDEEREALLPDLRTIRGIFNHIDTLNLHGLFFTGVEGWLKLLKEESNRFFLPNPRIMVMNNQELA